MQYEEACNSGVNQGPRNPLEAAPEHENEALLRIAGTGKGPRTGGAGQWGVRLPWIEG